MSPGRSLSNPGVSIHPATPGGTPQPYRTPSALHATIAVHTLPMGSYCALVDLMGHRVFQLSTSADQCQPMPTNANTRNYQCNSIRTEALIPRQSTSSACHSMNVLPVVYWQGSAVCDRWTVWYPHARRNGIQQHPMTSDSILLYITVTSSDIQ